MLETWVEEGVLKVRGVVATPRVSRNKVFYPPEELERAVKRLAGRPIPIYLEHVSAERAIGLARLRWDPEKLRVEFEGEIHDEEAAEKVRKGLIKHVSLGADYEVLEPGSGYKVARGLEFRELSLVAVPGIPEAGLEPLRLMERLEPKNPLARIGCSMDGRLLDVLRELRRALEGLEPEGVVEERVGGADYEAIARRLREALTSTSAPTIPQWTPPLINLPPGVDAGLRRFCRVAVLPRGTDRAIITKITTPGFTQLAEGQEIADSAQTMENIEIPTQEYGAAQTITDTVMESMTGELVQAIERALQRAAIRNEDRVIIDALASAQGLEVVYGGWRSAESEVTSADTLTWQLILEAKKRVLEKGREVGEGRLVLLIHPKQWLDLMNDIGANLIAAGDKAFVENGEVVRVFGVDIVVSDQLPTGMGNNITTHHGFLFVKEEALGLAVSRDLRIELDRDINKRATNIVATHRVGAKIIDPDSTVKIITV